jgi:hypothetical protein
VQRLCDEAGAGIVVSSTWRLVHELPRLRDLLAAQGLTATILGVTPSIPNRRGRGQEIQRWLDLEVHRLGLPVDGMVILDDEEEMFHLTPWLVRTSFARGLTDAHLPLARAILARPMPEIRRAPG